MCYNSFSSSGIDNNGKCLYLYVIPSYCIDIILSSNLRSSLVFGGLFHVPYRHKGDLS